MTDNPRKFGCLFGIGVGPGDPELITLKALKALQSAPVICVPQAANRRESYALSIVKEYVKPEQEILRSQRTTLMAQPRSGRKPQNWWPRNCEVDRTWLS